MSELWALSDGPACGLTREQFTGRLDSIASVEGGRFASEVELADFLRGLKLADLALAHGCALGLDAAWRRFIALYREALTRAGIAIARDEMRGRELADSLYAELYGLTSKEGERRSPLVSYAGRGSLMGWLRSTLAQRQVDHFRRTHREQPLEEEFDQAAPEPVAAATTEQRSILNVAVAEVLREVDGEDRFLLASYYLDQRTLLQIARLLRVHEATVSRKLKRLTAELRKQLIRRLQRDGMSKRAAEEILETDPRDLEINLRMVLQESQTDTFLEKTET